MVSVHQFLRAMTPSSAVILSDLLLQHSTGGHEMLHVPSIALIKLSWEIA